MLNTRNRLSWVKMLDGHKAKKIFVLNKDESTFYNNELDTQCRLPLPPIDELEKILDENTSKEYVKENIGPVLSKKL